MADTSTRTDAAPTVAYSPDRQYQPEVTGWVGWNIFAAAMMMIGGFLQGVYGFIAVVNDEWVVWGNRANLYIDLSAWGWIHMGVGVVAVLAGIGIMSGNVLARAVGVFAASLSFISNFLFLPAYPLWSIAVMTLNVLVIWALTVHGHEMRRPPRRADVDLTTNPSPIIR